MANSTVCQSKRKPIVEPRRAKPKTYRQAPTHWLKFYEEAVIESEAWTAVCNEIEIKLFVTSDNLFTYNKDSILPALVFFSWPFQVVHLLQLCIRFVSYTFGAQGAWAMTGAFNG